ncbi:hypothetical protein Tco_1173175 [Tanacetum coccineum]
MDITLTLSPITPLDVQFDTPSPSPPIVGHSIPWNLLEAHGDSCLSMIGSLMYLTAFRPDITFAVYACARFQVTPKISHLHVVKRIFIYLKGQPKLGLWYPRDSPFNLEAFSVDRSWGSLSMIGSLMYLTTFRPDITFVVYACARFQVTQKISHLHVVKRIFIYLKGQPKLGLWYPRDSPFNLEAFSDSDYAGASLDRKSTTGGCQFLGKRLISCIRKKQTIVLLTPILKRIDDSNGLEMLLDEFEVKTDETVHKKRGDRMERAHYSLLALLKLEQEGKW